MRSLHALVGLVAFAPLAEAQSTGRSMHLLAPAVIGQTASFAMTYPAAATGNLYAFLWCCPQFAGTTPLTVPGFTLLGTIRVNPATSISAYSGLLGVAGAVTHSVAIPNHPSFVGYGWDLQSVDLEAATSTLRFSDDELSLVISNLPPSGLIAIAPGTFPMGSNATTGSPYFSAATERPVHQVTISRPFWMGRWEVTQTEYQAVMGTAPSWFQGTNLPVEQVSWNDAMAYCAARTASEAAAGRLPSGYVYRLPTEAEWEYCCRAGTTTEFAYGAALYCWQDNLYSSNHSNSVCNPFTSGSTTAIGSYSSNAWGLYDMHGNVQEWCLDSWDGTANYPASAVTDPLGQSGPVRVVRGGSWGNSSDVCRSASRSFQFPGLLNPAVGFRVVLAPQLP